MLNNRRLLLSLVVLDEDLEEAGIKHNVKEWMETIKFLINTNVQTFVQTPEAKIEQQVKIRDAWEKKVLKNTTDVVKKDWHNQPTICGFLQESSNIRKIS